MLKLTQNSSGAHQAQGTNWLGVVFSGCQDSEITFCSNLRNLGCEDVGKVFIISQFGGLDQLFQVGWVFWSGTRSQFYVRIREISEILLTIYQRVD